MSSLPSTMKRKDNDHSQYDSLERSLIELPILQCLSLSCCKSCYHCQCTVTCLDIAVHLYSPLLSMTAIPAPAHYNNRKGSPPGWKECEQQLLEAVNLYPRTTLVLDALDECDERSRIKFMQTIDFLVNESERALKVFISSRPDGDIKHRYRT